jgi:hypothetical protein
MKVLFAITTLDQIPYTKQTLQSISNCENIDIELFDDCSKDAESLKSLGIMYGAKFNSKDKPQGLTDSWNRIYRKFKESNYDACFISNNDVITTASAVRQMIKALQTNPLVVPLSSVKSVSGFLEQTTQKYGVPDIMASNPFQVGSIQNTLLRLHKNNPYSKLPRFHGFFFGFNRNIFSQEYDKDHLFNPDCINIGNEDELSERLTIRPIVVKTAFVFHYKAVTLGHDYEGDRNVLSRYHK